MALVSEVTSLKEGWVGEVLMKENEHVSVCLYVYVYIYIYIYKY